MTTVSRVVSSGTSFPNTPESDRQHYVLHDVTVETTDGRCEVVRLPATDPLGAMDAVRSMRAEQFMSLPRVRAD